MNGAERRAVVIGGDLGVEDSRRQRSGGGARRGGSAIMEEDVHGLLADQGSVATERDLLVLPLLPKDVALVLALPQQLYQAVESRSGGGSEEKLKKTKKEKERKGKGKTCLDRSTPSCPGCPISLQGDRIVGRESSLQRGEEREELEASKGVNGFVEDGDLFFPLSQQQGKDSTRQNHLAAGKD